MCAWDLKCSQEKSERVWRKQGRRKKDAKQKDEGRCSHSLMWSSGRERNYTSKCGSSRAKQHVSFSVVRFQFQ